MTVEVFDIIDEVLRANETPYYSIGVSAIALELLKVYSTYRDQEADKFYASFARAWLQL